MIKDINTIENLLVDADICIIGTGAAGITLGLELENSGKKVVILEGGSMQKTQINQSFYDLENINLPIDPDSRIRTFGGTTTVWGGGWKPLDQMDFEKKDWVPFSGWPITKGTLIPYYERGAKMFGGPTLEEFEISNVRKFLRNRNNYILDTKEIKTTLLRILPREKWNFARNYRHIFELSSSIEVLFNAPVTKIILDSKNEKVAEVVVQTLLGKKINIKAKHYIVACGGIENARLLIFSEIGNKYDQVGRYYMDHPKFVSGSVVPERRNLNLSLYWKPQDINGLAIAGLQLSDDTQRSLGVLNSYVHFLPRYVSDQYAFIALKVFASNNILSKAFRALMRRYIGVSEVRVRNFMEQAPYPENRVSLSSKKDLLGNPLARVEWSLSSLDKKSLFALHTVLRKELRQNHISDLTSPILDYTETFVSVRDASHHMGTTRMGTDPRYSVVDENCRVHDIENLFVAGSSVFPTSGHANPTVTIIALAVRLADYVKFL